MRVVAVAIDKLELIRCDRHRVANGVTVLWVSSSSRLSEKLFL
ncbi:hypothetical protein [Nostoc sp. CALU 546]